MASKLGVYPKTLDYHQAFTTAFTATLPFVAPSQGTPAATQITPDQPNGR
jgi:hypothetical protein